MTDKQLNGALAWVSAKSSEGYNICHWLLSLGSTYLIFTKIIRSGLDAGYHYAIVYVAAYAIAAAWYVAIEHTLKVLLPFAVAYILTDKATAGAMNKNARRAGRMSIATVCVLLTATLGLSIAINPEISSDVTKKESSETEIALDNSTRESYDKDVAIYQSELAQARVEDAKAIKDAEADAARWVRAAQDVQGSNLGNLIRKGHGWAKTQLTPAQKRKIAYEQARGEKHIQSARDNAIAPALQGKLTAYMERSGAARDTVAMTTAALVFGREEDYKGKVSGLNNVLLFTVLGLFLAYVFLCFQMVLGRIERGEDIVDDDSPGVFKVLKKSAVTMNKKLGKQLAEKWDVKFVSTLPELSVAGGFAPAEKSVAEYAENSLSGGFQAEKSAPVIVTEKEPAEKATDKVSAPPPPGLALPKKVSPDFWAEEATAYRKRVYGWWATAHNKKKPVLTREDNKTKAEAAFVWFRSMGCTVTVKTPGKVSIKFPKS